MFHPDILAKGDKMVHAINEEGAMCFAGVQSRAVARGVRGHAPPPPQEKKGFSETHSGAF